MGMAGLKHPRQFHRTGRAPMAVRRSTSEVLHRLTLDGDALDDLHAKIDSDHPCDRSV